MIWARFAPIRTPFASRIATRGLTLPLDEFHALDRRRRAAITESEQLRAEQNAMSREIATLRKEGVDTSAAQQRSREMSDRIAELAKDVETADASFREMLAGIPNVPHESVPVGRSAEDNVEVRRVGEPFAMDFAPKAHWIWVRNLGFWISTGRRKLPARGSRFTSGWARNWSGR